MFVRYVFAFWKIPRVELYESDMLDTLRKNTLVSTMERVVKCLALHGSAFFVVGYV